MNLFLTGATGFVGRNFLLRALAGGEFKRIACSVRNGGKLVGQLAVEGIGGIPECLEIIEGTHFDWGFSRASFAPDVCLHLAGILFARDEEQYIDGNVRGAERLLSSIPAHCPLVAVSSQSALGATPWGSAPLAEDALPHPLSHYGRSKLGMERALDELRDGREIYVLRPPIILGPRDSATLPLFRMAAGPLLLKPGTFDKTLSWISVADFVEALIAVLLRVCAGSAPGGGLWHVAAAETITDTQLLLEAARATGANGRLVRVPTGILKIAAAASACFPSIGRAVPSLMPDRALELFEDRWTIDPAKFCADFCWRSTMPLDTTIRLAWEAAKPVLRPAS